MKKVRLSRIVICGSCIFLIMSVKIYAMSSPPPKQPQKKQHPQENGGMDIITGPDTIITVPSKWSKGLLKDMQDSSSRYEPIKIGKRYYRDGNYEEAIVWFKKALANPHLGTFESSAYLWLIDSYEKNTQYTEAAEMLEKRLIRVHKKSGKTIPEWSEHLTYLEYAAQGNFDLAIKHAQKAAEITEKEPVYHKFYLERLKDLEARAREQEDYNKND
jgi:tetratricopeptide (TPR) repeat protein